MEFLLFILLIAVLLGAVMFSIRISRLRSEIEQLRGELHQSTSILQSLLGRVFELEGRLQRETVREPMRSEAPIAMPTMTADPEPSVVSYVPEFPTEAERPLRPVPEARPAQDLEALIGGNLLKTLSTTKNAVVPMLSNV